MQSMYKIENYFKISILTKFQALFKVYCRSEFNFNSQLASGILKRK